MAGHSCGRGLRVFKGATIVFYSAAACGPPGLSAMKAQQDYIRLAASDLSNHLACAHLTTLDLGVVRQERQEPQWSDPHAVVLRERGFAHEHAYLKLLADSGLCVRSLDGRNSEREAIDETAIAMKEGVDVIAQAALADGRWFGRADVLRRVEQPSALGGWSYEVYDCKLARETKGATMLQISLYSELLAQTQGRAPEYMYVVPPVENFVAETYRVSEFAAYYRLVKGRLEGVIGKSTSDLRTYPEPNPHCEVCRWWKECDARRRGDDHLSLVAGISKLQRKQLGLWQIGTVAKLAELPIPLQQRPEFGSKEGYERVREQARLQVEARVSGDAVFEMLEVQPERGLTRLPEPTAADIFFDLEGDPFVDGGGMEYLFGFANLDDRGRAVYHCRWCRTREEERDAFRWFVDFVMEEYARNPGMHVYHYAPYEPAALKRLMGRYATREDEVDRMLRAGLLVDLHSILKQSVRAGVEEYSLKTMEAFHDFRREVPLEEAAHARHLAEHRLELGRLLELEDEIHETITGYNRDDCLSTLSLRDWLEAQRGRLMQAGRQIPRPPLEEGAPPPMVDERQQRVQELVERLTEGLPVDARERNEAQAAEWLLANLLDWHRREDKADWWEFFRLRDLFAEDLLDEKAGLSGLQLLERVRVERKIPVDRYRFDLQDTNVRARDKVSYREQPIGRVEAMDLGERTVDIKKTRNSAEIHPPAVYTFERVDSDELADSLFRIGAWVADNGIDAKGRYRAARDLLLRRPPRLMDQQQGNLTRAGEDPLDTAKRIALSLSESVLAVQGPPGAGKTYTGARMICALLRQHKRVGVTATSHKVIRNLLDEVVRAAASEGPAGLICIQKVKERSEVEPRGIKEVEDNADALAGLSGGCVLGGTAWLWSRGEFADSVDVLFVDEAGQMSLANVVAVSQAARSVVLLGDPQQLEQPLKGSHPEGAEVSALEHMMAGAKTVRSDQGLFLPVTWRLHPEISGFTSEAFYEGRLESLPGLENQRIEGSPGLGSHGLRFVPVAHEGNSNSSLEEVECIAKMVTDLIANEVYWIDAKGKRSRIGWNDILIVAPYNAQVSNLAARLKQARVGTVDKFQGQEAPIVIYSLTTSSPEDAPRGMEFLYSLNRLNVATSRARALCIVVGSPRLLEPECRTPHQMRLANALCRYIELAQERAGQPLIVQGT